MKRHSYIRTYLQRYRVNVLTTTVESPLNQEASMQRTAKTSLSQPVFREPVFNEATQTVDPSGFLVPHPSDAALFKQINNLLTKDVVAFKKSTVKDGEVMQLSDAYGDHGPDLIKQITAAKKIIFHALGDSGASVSGKKFANELNVADQCSM